MQINIHTRHIDLNAEHEDYIKSKLLHLSEMGGRMGDESVIADVHVDKVNSHGQGLHVIMKVNIAVPHDNLHAEVENAMQVTEAIDMIVEKLKQQIDRYKAKVM